MEDIRIVNPSKHDGGQDFSPPRLRAELSASAYAPGKREQVERAWLADIRFYVINFMLGERPLAATQFWNYQPNLIAAYVGQCLLHLRADDHRLIISPYSGPDYARRILGRKRWLTAQQALYFDQVLSGRALDLAWLTYKSDDDQWGTMLIEPPLEAVTQIAEEFFGYGFEGYLIRQSTGVSLVQLIPPVTPGRVRFKTDISWQRTLRRHLDLASVYFEEWSEESAVRLWTVSMSREEIARRLRLDEINSMLAQVELPPRSAAAGTVSGSGPRRRSARGRGRGLVRPGPAGAG